MPQQVTVHQHWLTKKYNLNPGQASKHWEGEGNYTTTALSHHQTVALHFLGKAAFQAIENSQAQHQRDHRGKHRP